MQAGYGEGHLNILSSERTPRIGASSGSPGLLQPILYIYKFITRTIVVYFYDNFPLPMPDGHSTTALSPVKIQHPRQARNIKLVALWRHFLPVLLFTASTTTKQTLINNNVNMI